MIHFDIKKKKTTLRNQIIKDFPLSKSYIVPGNARSIYKWMILFCMGKPQHNYRDELEVVTKTVAKQAHQNQAINIEIKDQ